MQIEGGKVATITLHVDQLKGLYASIITRFGGSPEEAAIFADRFVLADLRGMEWQGLKSLELHVVDPIKQGYSKLGQEVTIEEEGPSSIAYEARNELGQVVCRQAMYAAIAKARESGSAAFTIRHSGDTGLLGSYTLLALDQQCIAIMFNNTNPYIAPWGGADRVNGIDPLSIAIPAQEELPILLDMAITTGRLNFDKDEVWAPPFDSPPVIPFETLREYVLSVTLELMSGALTDMPLGREKTRRGESAVFGTVVHIPHFIAMPVFLKRADAFIRQVKSTPRADGFDEILLPGERGFKEHERRLKEGVPIEEAVWDHTVQIAESLGVDWRAAMESPPAPVAFPASH